VDIFDTRNKKARERSPELFCAGDAPLRVTFRGAPHRSAAFLPNQSRKAKPARGADPSPGQIQQLIEEEKVVFMILSLANNDLNSRYYMDVFCFVNHQNERRKSGDSHLKYHAQIEKSSPPR
jgi:hypothetical protein